MTTDLAPMTYDTFAAALGICHRDVISGVRWAKWLRYLGGLRETPIWITFTLMAYQSERPACNRLVSEIESTFAQAHVDVIDDSGRRHPSGANQLFLHTMRQARSAGRPIIWMETDLVPLAPDWVPQVAADYTSSGLPFAGPLCGQVTRRAGEFAEYMNGTGIYPPNWEEITDLATVPDNDAFDTWAAATIRPVMHCSPLWQHRSYVGSGAFAGAKPEHVRPGVILFHQDKHLNLARPA